MSHNRRSPSGGRTPSSSTNVGSIGDILEHALKRRGLSKQTSRYSGFHLWPEIVGPDIAAVAEPLRIVRGNVLQLKVIDPVWAQELAMRKFELVEKLAGGILGSVIEDIQFIIEGPKGRPER